MIERLVKALLALDIEVDWRQLADMLWLAQHTGPGVHVEPLSTNGSEVPAETAGPEDTIPAPVQAGHHEVTGFQAVGATSAGGEPQRFGSGSASDGQSERRTVGIENAPLSALPGQLEIAKALRPLKQRRQSLQDNVFDAEATVNNFCETGVLVPILKPTREAWFEDLALVVDGAATMVVWEETIEAFSNLLQRQGAFGRVSRWTLHGNAEQIFLRSPSGHRSDPRQVIEYNTRCLVLLISDCVGPLWHEEAMWEVLESWGRLCPVALVQTLPPRLWPATALGPAEVSVTSQGRAQPNQRLTLDPPWWWIQDEAPEHGIPVVTLDEDRLRMWARMVMGESGAAVAGVILPPPHTGTGDESLPQREPKDHVGVIRSTISWQAWRLATLLSAVEVTLPVARIILYAMIPEARQTHLAEVLASGLLDQSTDFKNRGSYEFRPGTREILQESLSSTDILQVWRTVEPYVQTAMPGLSPFSLVFNQNPQVLENDDIPAMARIASRLAARLGLSRSFTSSASVLKEDPQGGTRHNKWATVSSPGRAGHGRTVVAAAIAADGSRAVTVSMAGTAQVWDPVATLGPTHELSHPPGLTAVAITSDGTRAVTASTEGTAKVWDLITGQELHLLDRHSSGVTAVAITTDGTRAVTASSEGTAKVWDLITGKKLHHLDRHSSGVTAVAITTDGTRAVTTSTDGTAKVWDLLTGKELHTLSGHVGTVHAVAITADGTRAVTTGSDGTARLWDLVRGLLLHTLTGHSGPVTGVYLTTDDIRALTTSTDGTVRLWDLVTGSTLQTLDDGYSGPTVAAALTTDSTRAITTSESGMTYLWDLATGTKEQIAMLSSGGTCIGTARDHGQDLVLLGEVSGGVTVLVTQILTGVPPTNDTKIPSTPNIDRPMDDPLDGGQSSDQQSPEVDGNEAVALYRKRAAADPAYTPDLAAALTTLSDQLDNMGRLEDALAAAKEATDLYQELAADDADAFGESLAAALIRLSDRFNRIGRIEEASAAAEQATRLYRELAAAGSAHRGGLASSLNSLSLQLALAGHLREALATGEEATSLYRRLAADDPDAYTEGLAAALNNFSRQLEIAGRQVEALATGEEATSLYRRLAADDPDAYTGRLAAALDSLSKQLNSAGYRDESLAACQESTALYRRLAAGDSTYAGDLGKALINLSARLNSVERRDEAVAVREEAATLYRFLAADNPAYTPDLAAALISLSHEFDGVDRPDKAAAVGAEATNLYRRMVTDTNNPATTIILKKISQWAADSGDLATAVAQSRELLQAQVWGLGPNHPDTLTTRREVAYWEGESGDLSEALVQFRELLQAQVRVLGPDHPDTLKTRSDLAYWTGRSGNLAGAVAQSRESLQAQVRVLGPDHPDTLKTRSDLAYWTGKAGDVGGAVAQSRELLQAQVRVLGPDHPDTLKNRSDLAYWIGEHGDGDDDYDQSSSNNDHQTGSSSF